MSKTEILSAIQAMLFSSGEPVSLDRLAQALEITDNQAEKYVEEIKTKFQDNAFGIEIIRLENSYQMVSKSKYAPQVRQIFEMKRNTPLSRAAFEVLSVIAYNQPVTKAYVEQVRGVDCSGVVSSLCMKGLIEECGRLDLPGRPLIYKTTDHFLRCFSLDSISDLPEIPQSDENNSDKSEDNTQENIQPEQVSIEQQTEN